MSRSRGPRLCAAMVQAVVVTNGRKQSVDLTYRHSPTLPDVIFEVLQAGTPPEVCGLGTIVEHRVAWTLREAAA